MVERDLAKVEVASSTLVSRSSFERQKLKGKRQKLLFYFYLFPFAFFVRRRSQVVRQSSAKALFIGSIPIAASINTRFLATYSGSLFIWRADDCERQTVDVC